MTRRASGKTVQYQSSGSTLANSHALFSGDGGSTWLAYPQRSLPILIYGAFSTTDPADYRYILRAARLRIRLRDDPTGFSTTLRIANEPEVDAP